MSDPYLPERKSVVVKYTTTHDKADMVQEAARLMGLTLAEYLRRIVETQAREDIRRNKA